MIQQLETPIQDRCITLSLVLFHHFKQKKIGTPYLM